MLKANIPVSKRGGCTVEAAIPLTAPGITPQPNLTLAGDFGATSGDPAGYELMLEPENWGQLTFGKVGSA